MYWKSRLRDLLHDCAASGPSEQADRVADAAELLCIDTPSVQEKLRVGACESAVMEIIGGETSFMLSRGGSGRCLATVVLPDGSEEVISEGSTLALALLAAHLSALLEDADMSGVTTDGVAFAAGLRAN